MRQLIFTIICVMTVMPSFGKLRLKMLETTDSTTVITLKEKNMCRQASATASRLYNDGTAYNALAIKNSYENCCNVYEIVFPRQVVFNNTKIELTIDGKTIMEEIWEQISKALLHRYFHMTDDKEDI